MSTKVNSSWLWVWLLFAILLFGACFSSPSTNSNATDMTELQQFREKLGQMPKASHIYLSTASLLVNFFPEGVPIFSPDELPVEELSELEHFFYMELQPGWKQFLSPAQISKAYCAALQHLQGDWWGPLGSLDSPLCEHILRTDGMEECLIQQLDNEKPVQYLEGEEATFAHLYKLSVADLAGLFLGKLKETPYPVSIELTERRARRQVFKKQFSNQ